MIVKLDLSSKIDKFYTNICNIAEKEKVFKACGNLENKWVMLRFEDVDDYVTFLKKYLPEML